MKLTPVRGWPPAVRGIVAASACVLAFVLFLVVKYEAIGFFVVHRVWGVVLSLAGFGLVALACRRALDVGALSLATIATPLTLLMVVALVVTPLPYEVAHVAATMPHPGGALAANVTTAQFFDVNHPIASVDFPYAAGTNVTTLERAAIDALRAAGWSVEGETEPGGPTGDLGSVNVARDGFHGFCTFGARDGPRMSCSLTV